VSRLGKPATRTVRKNRFLFVAADPQGRLSQAEIERFLVAAQALELIRLFISDTYEP